MKRKFRRTFYAQHIHYQDFDSAEMIEEKPVYVNFIREPVSRFISHFYFRRFSSDATKIKNDKNGLVDKIDIICIICHSAIIYYPFTVLLSLVQTELQI